MNNNNNLQVLIVKFGNRYWLPLLEIHRRYVVTKLGRTRFHDVEGYRLPWTGKIAMNEQFFESI